MGTSGAVVLTAAVAGACGFGDMVSHPGKFSAETVLGLVTDFTFVIPGETGSRTGRSG